MHAPCIQLARIHFRPQSLGDPGDASRVVSFKIEIAATNRTRPRSAISRFHLNQKRCGAAKLDLRHPGRVYGGRAVGAMRLGFRRRLYKYKYHSFQHPWTCLRLMEHVLPYRPGTIPIRQIDELLALHVQGWRRSTGHLREPQMLIYALGPGAGEFW